MSDPREYIPDPTERWTPIPEGPPLELKSQGPRGVTVMAADAASALVLPIRTAQPSWSLIQTYRMAGQLHPPQAGDDGYTDLHLVDAAVLICPIHPPRDDMPALPVLLLGLAGGGWCGHCSDGILCSLAGIIALAGPPPWKTPVPVRLQEDRPGNGTVMVRLVVDRGAYAAAIDAARPQHRGG